MGSARESEVVELYYNCKSALQLKTCLEEMGHPQPQMPAITDNSTAAGLITKTMTPKRAKACDQRFNWVKCREAQKQFNLIWRSGKLNWADYNTANMATFESHITRDTPTVIFCTQIK